MFKLIINKPSNLKNDLLSGLTVALALVPEAIAFSFVAGVNPKVGLLAAFMMGLITAVIGGRPGMISGATGAIAVIFAPLVAKILEQTDGDSQTALGYLFSAVILMGVIQIIFGVLKLGKFIRLMPHPVMLGFVNGLAIIIFKAQFSQFYVTGEAGETLLAMQPLLIMCALIALTMAISHFLPKLTTAVPATLTGIVVVSVIAYFLNKNGFEVRTVLDYVRTNDPNATVKTSLPTFALPHMPFTWDAIKLILPFSILAAAVGLIESLMTLSLIDEITETRGRGNKESIGQGVANIVNGFFGGMGGCAMIGQSMINIRAGGRSRWSGASAAIFLLCFIVWGSVLIEMIPLAALVGVMFMVVIGTFEWSSFRIMRKVPKSDAFVIILVSVVTVIADLAIAVIAGLIASALVFAWKHGKKIYVNSKTNDHGHKIYQLEGLVFFGSASNFKELFDVKNDPEDVIIDFANARVCDHSGIEAIDNISKRYAAVNKKLHLLNLSKECSELIAKADNIVEISIIEDLDWHLAVDKLA
ncbi:SulP family inorganic anion transporter [Lentisphaerota bacterium WC36G]|nr:SulP family inorganic anion transporter [Lentisphaerae bacterium WC36]